MKIHICRKPNTEADADVTVLMSGPVPGSLPLPEYGGGVQISPVYELDGYLCVSAVTPEGVFTQKALSEYDYKSGSELACFDVCGVKCALAVGCDVYRPEIFRYLAMNGVMLVFCQHCAAVDDLRFGPWSNAQANNLFLVDVSCQGASVIGQCDLVPDRSGFFLKNSPDGGLVELPTERFWEGQRNFPVFQSMNYALYRRYFGGEKI